MKTRRFLFAALCLMVAFSAAAAPKAPKPIKVLAIGNSFSEDAVEQNLWEIADAAGTPMIIGNMYIGGCPLEKHWKNAEEDASAYKYRKIVGGEKTETPGMSLSKALADEKWDVVTFQQSSPNSGKFETYEPYLKDLVEYVRYRVPKKARMMFHQTWAYENYSVHQAFPSYDRSPGKMFEAIAEASSKACEKYKLEMIPAGTAIQSARKSEIKGNVTRDGHHLNYVGRYIAALTWFEAITGKSVVGNSYDAPHVEDWMKQVAQEAAHAAVQEPGKPKHVGPKAYATNKDESKVEPYTLPDALVMEDGTPVTTKEQWYKQRRPEILKFFTEQMYGKSPKPSKDIHFKIVEQSSEALGGKATRKQVKLYPVKNEKYCLNLLIYLPNGAEGPVPVFAGINFKGNWGISEDPAIIMPGKNELKRYGVLENLERGVNARRWPLEQIIDAGYGVVTFYRGDADPDFNDGFRNGLTPLIYKKGQTWPEPDQWGAISAWAWGLSRVLDYCGMDNDIDEKKVAVIGHSRLGKTALWAGAQDKRFALVISNCSGEGGAALTRRVFGETVQDLNRHFPHWFCGNFRQFNGKDREIPYDQHELMALIAPRPLYVAGADGDEWADPMGQFLAAREASKVYEFLGRKGLAIKEYPPVETPSLKGNIGFHNRHGKHDIVSYDWAQYIAFADKYFKK